MSFLSSIGDVLHKGIDGLKTIAKVAFAFGDDLVNGIKAIEATPLGADIVSAVEVIAGAVIPAAYLNAFKTFLPVFIKDMGWVQGELSKPDDQIISDFVTWFNSIASPNAKASVAHVVAANVSQFVSDVTNAGNTIQQSLTLPQIVHDPSLFDVVSIAPAVAAAPAKKAA